VVLVVIAGHTLALETESRVCNAVLYAFLPSEAGGTAIVNTLLGDSAPSGRLPITLYPRSILFERDPGDMSLRGGPGVTYLHYPANRTVYPFGWGLSYSAFEFAWDDDDKDVVDSGGVGVGVRSRPRLETTSDFDVLKLPAVRVTNVGSVRSSVTVNGYVHHRGPAYHAVALELSLRHTKKAFAVCPWPDRRCAVCSHCWIELDSTQRSRTSCALHVLVADFFFCL
jgi:hypothetical protein